jgi:hypothetical protein
MQLPEHVKSHALIFSKILIILARKNMKKYFWKIYLAEFVGVV